MKTINNSKNKTTSLIIEFSKFIKRAKWNNKRRYSFQGDYENMSLIK